MRGKTVKRKEREKGKRRKIILYGLKKEGYIINK